ncbi:amino acid adenylation protein [Corynebacterium diphtheriae]|nr:amino acid adenylation protein [Corynebacterium diphtheriae]
MVVPEQFLRSDKAPRPRTLVDIFRSSVAAFPEAAALDCGDVLTYADLAELVDDRVAQLHAAGVGAGCRVGVRLPSGQPDLYVTILAVLCAGAAYVPVDADDPDERAELVFGEAHVDAVWSTAGLRVTTAQAQPLTAGPHLEDTAWIIFTSGSTGKPKGVAVSHRSAAAFVDAERELFVRDQPIGPDDRVLAGLSVAFDASCEEMWLAWGHGACLVPAPRSLVRTGLDLGPWLISRDISIVSTVPTLAGMWPAEALDNVRLLILGGEACSAELVARVASSRREVWNTYGPTEATVVTCAARLEAGQPVAIGLPLAGWDTAVVGADGQPVAMGDVGELVIGGVGLARYLDPVKDREKFSAKLGWERAYRSGDHVRLCEDGLYFVGRIDDQVKIGGRRIELGEVEAHVAALPNVAQYAVVVRETAAGEKVLVAYVSPQDPDVDIDTSALDEMPRAMVPRLVVLPEIPTTTSGKSDKKALPWPLESAQVTGSDFTPTQQWLAQLWVDVLGVPVGDVDADFFALGGTSLAAAKVVSRIRQKTPTMSVRDLYDHPRLGALAEVVEQLPGAAVAKPRELRPVPWVTRVVQAAIIWLCATIRAVSWVAWLLVINNVAAGWGASWARPLPWLFVVLFTVLVATPVGRLPLGAWSARLITARISPGDYPRGGVTHVRLWAAQRLFDAFGAGDIAGATWVNYCARMLGAQVGRGVDLHTMPPVTGLLRLGDHCAVEPEVDLSGVWVDGDVVHVGAIEIAEDARVGARSTLLPGTVIGAGAHIEAGSTVTGAVVKVGARWSGSPAAKVGRSKHRFPNAHPPRRSRWVPVYGVSSLVLALLPLLAVAAGMVVVWRWQERTHTALWWWVPLGVVAAMGLYALLVVVLVRLLGWRLSPGITAVRSARGWRVWCIERLLDDARTYLFPLYASLITPWWFRLLGAKVGKDVEISTAVMVPSLSEIRDRAFLADDTLIGGYELGGGWMRLGRTIIGKRSFVGNSGIALQGRKLAKNSLVAVLSQVPKKARSGSNWWGSPPERMRRVTVNSCAADTSTFYPTVGKKFLRAMVEILRLTAPMTSGFLLAAVLVSAQWLLGFGVVAALFGTGLALCVAGALAITITAAVKWCSVGRHRPGNHPLWSWFVWLNELQDTFVEVVAAPWFFQHCTGSGLMNAGLRLLGVHIGPGAWIESYWFPETDLCHVGTAATVGPGTVVQTHLFHDRVMSLDHVHIGAGATLAAHSVMLPASRIGEATTVGPGSLVMRGDDVPAHSHWQGNPIATTTT